MKKWVLLAIGLMLMAAGAGTSQATPFSNTVDFDGSGTNSDRTFKEIGDNPGVFNWSYTHNVVFDPAATEVVSAVLTLSHMKNSNTTTGELWMLYGGTATPLGTLQQSETTWLDQVFVLPAILYNSIVGGGWTLALNLQETTSGMDKIYIDKSVLSGEYAPVNPTSDPESAPVPEPGTVMMLGLGLAGLAVYGKRRKN